MFLPAWTSGAEREAASPGARDFALEGCTCSCPKADATWRETVASRLACSDRLPGPSPVSRAVVSIPEPPDL